MTQTQAKNEAAMQATVAGLEGKMLATLEAQALANQKNMEYMTAQMAAFMKESSENIKITTTPRKAKRSKLAEREAPDSADEHSDDDEPMKSAQKLLEEDDAKNMDFDEDQVQPHALLFDDEDGNLLSQDDNMEITATQLADGLEVINIGSQDDSNNNGDQRPPLGA